MHKRTTENEVLGSLPCSEPAQTWKAGEDIVREYERIDVATHPLFVDLASRPVDLGAIWVLVANLHVGISDRFVPWLARTIARLEDRRIASLLAKQLNDELGNGDFAQIHSVLLQRFLEGLDPWRPEGSDQELLWPGTRLGRNGNALFDGNDPYEPIGALVVGEIFAKKMDHCLGEEIRRQNAVSADALRWLVIHESLEVDHADDSLVLARLIPTSDTCMGSTSRGAKNQWRLLWDFLDGVHSVASHRHLKENAAGGEVTQRSVRKSDGLRLGKLQQCVAQL
jgi:pyrroloquinoline quinone (PQQ) biosynthesis protein C